jgi:hypothetical protein
MNPEIMAALDRLHTTLCKAVRKDTMAEMAEEWAPAKLKACETAWAEAKAARLELETIIAKAVQHAATAGPPTLRVDGQCAP